MSSTATLNAVLDSLYEEDRPCRTSYMVQHMVDQKSYLGNRRFTYKDGSHAWFTTFEHGRIYNRRQDAVNAAKVYSGTVVEVQVFGPKTV